MESLPYAGAGFVLLSHDGGSVLLICDARSRKWGFPKGHREPEDASDLHTAVRECREEVGLDASAYTVWEPAFRLTRGSASYLFRYAVLKHKEDMTTLSLRQGEIEAAVWVPVASLLLDSCPYTETGNKYLRTWISDLNHADEECRRKSMLVYRALTLSCTPSTEPVRVAHVVTRA